MKGFKFTRTYADLQAAAWCDFVERGDGIGQDGDPVFIHVRQDWLPSDCDQFSACGDTLKEALRDLRDLWTNDMRPPANAA